MRAGALATTYRRVDEQAARACRAALLQLYHHRDWERVWQTMESVGLVLASTGRVEQASIVLGHLEVWQPHFGRETIFGFRDRALELVRRDAHAESWMALGAAMDRDEIVLLALEHLAS
jgi:hypothetical protein